MTKNNPASSIILFDGSCNFCNASVNFVIRHSRKETFIPVPLQSDYAKELLKNSGLPEYYSGSMVLIENGKIYLKSTAALRIAKKSDPGIRWLYAFIIFPRFLRDIVYKIIARHRRMWFGKQKSCVLPLDSERKILAD